MNKPNQLETRLDRLERRNRVLSIMMIAMAGVAIVACATLSANPAQQTSATLSTNLLRIVDANDHVVAELGQDGLLIHDDQQRIRVSLHHNDEETGLYLRDEAGDSRVGVVHFAHGGSGVALHGPGVRGAAVLYLKNTGSLTFYDADGGVIERVPGQ